MYVHYVNAPIVTAASRLRHRPPSAAVFPGFQHSRSDRTLQYVDPQAIQMNSMLWIEQWERGIELERGCMK